MNKIREQFKNSLLELYNTDIVNILIGFLQGKQAVLFAIKYSPGILASDISKKLNITKSRMTSIIAGLAKNHFIYIVKDDDDKRRQKIYLTDNGRNFITEKEEQVLVILDLYMEKMGNEKIKQFTKLITESVTLFKEEKQ